MRVTAPRFVRRFRGSQLNHRGDRLLCRAEITEGKQRELGVTFQRGEIDERCKASKLETDTTIC